MFVYRRTAYSASTEYNPERINCVEQLDAEEFILLDALSEDNWLCEEDIYNRVSGTFLRFVSNANKLKFLMSLCKSKLVIRQFIEADTESQTITINPAIANSSNVVYEEPWSDINE